MSKMASKYVWLFAVVVVWSQCLHPSVSVRTRNSLSSLMKILSQQTEPWCRHLNSRGCCLPKAHNGCRVNATFSCYCDASCRSFGDCCSDTEELRCNAQRYPCSAFSSNNSVDGCCTGPACFNETSRCYCDRACFERSDCCDHMEEVRCFPGNCRRGKVATCCQDRPDNCRVRISPSEYCYCDRDCAARSDSSCCEDQTCSTPTADTPPTTAMPTPPTTTMPPPTTEIPTPPATPHPTNATPVYPCSALASNNSVDGCCAGTMLDCFNENLQCACDRACFGRDGDCCNQMEEIGCFPKNCVGGKVATCCKRNLDNCKVRISPTEYCYCDEDCVDRHNCCEDQACSTPTTDKMEAVMEGIEDLVKTKIMYERVAAAFWRQYNLVNRLQRLRKKKLIM